MVDRASIGDLSGQRGALSRLRAHLQLHYKLVKGFTPPYNLPTLMDGVNLR